MKAEATFLVVCLVLCGCASRKQASIAPRVWSFSGHSPTAFGSDAEEIWRQHLGNPVAGGTKRRAIVRSLREGNASFSIDGGDTWKKLRVGALLRENSSIRTDSAATVVLFLAENGPVMRLSPDTEVRIERLRLGSFGAGEVVDTMIDLRKGRILGNVKKMPTGSSYLIRGQAGVIQIRGTAL